MNHKVIIILLTILPAITIFPQDNIITRWHKTDLLIMERRIPKDAAIDSIAKYVEATKEILSTKKFRPTVRAKRVFPMTGWTKLDYRQNGEDYDDIYFDYFQGSESSNHPAHDIFILDKDSNGVEDSTGKKVEALSMVNGIVFTVVADWKTGDRGRGGNYIKIYDPESDAMFYYSHVDSVFVNVGDIVTAGQSIAYIGRTGRKAIKGKTHLHIAFYRINDGYPEPENIIDDLYEAQKRYRP